MDVKRVGDICWASSVGILLEQWGSRVVQGRAGGEHELSLFDTRELTLGFTEGVWRGFSVGSGGWLSHWWQWWRWKLWLGWLGCWGAGQKLEPASVA